MADENPTNQKNLRKPIEWSKFLAEVPPYRQMIVNNLSVREKSTPYETVSWRMATPTIKIYCDSSVCNDLRFFNCKDRSGFLYESFNDYYLTYICKHCERTPKTFAIRARRIAETVAGEAVKMGELPAFGPPIPTRLNDILGDDRELFFTGRRAESQGMGIGAYAYYRRVVDNRRISLIDYIIKVLKRINAKQEIIDELEVAKEDTRFKESINKIKDGFPEILKIGGENPLTLLYGPLSGGLHEWSEEECLKDAASIRLVLTDLCEKMGQALKEKADLDEAVKRLKKTREKK